MSGEYETYYDERFEHYRSLGHCSATAAAWAKLDADAQFNK